MNKEQFIKYATDFSSLNNTSLEELKLLIDEFPHFQTAWVLYAKNLDKIKDVRFENNLKIAATHVADRRVLKHIIEGTYPTQLPNEKTSTQPENELETKSKIISNEIPQVNEDKDLIVPVKEFNSEHNETSANQKLEYTNSDTETLVPEIEELQINSKSPEQEELMTKIEDNSILSNINLQSEKTTDKEQEINNLDPITAKSESNYIPDTSSADRILQNIESIKSGETSTATSDSDADDKKQDLEQIITQRLKELGINQEHKKSNLYPENGIEILDSDEFTKSETSSNKEKQYAKPNLKSEDFLNFEFENQSSAKNDKKNIELNIEQKTELIDKFLSSNPRIVSQKNYTSNGSLSADLALSENEELFSETLAKIYIKQSHFDKAILTYEKLCLKYPEKNIYFAGQIEKIKELIKNK